MTLIPPSVLSRPCVLQAVILARRVFASWYTRDAVDIIRERASLAAVKEMEQNASWRPVDVSTDLKTVAGIDSHFGCQSISKVLPLAYAWAGDLQTAQQLVSDRVPSERLPCTAVGTPLVALIDYISESANGHPGLIHGGMTAIIAHSSMSLVAALNVPRQPTAEVISRSLNMDYRRPIRTGQFVKIYAWLYRHYEQGPMLAAVHFYDPNGQMLVEATAKLDIVRPGAAE